jgi:hypothetical protein
LAAAEVKKRTRKEFDHKCPEFLNQYQNMSPETKAYLRSWGFDRGAEESSSEHMANVSLDDLPFQESLGRQSPDAARKGKNVAHTPSIYHSDEEDLLEEADHESADGNLQQCCASYVYNGYRVITDHDIQTIYSFNDSVLISRSLASIFFIYLLTVVIYRRIF